MNSNKNFDLIVAGGGAAGFFGALSAASQGCSVLILEKRGAVLSKVRVSGGGRCNVTHACFEPHKLISFYPRGAKALLGPFNRFGPTQMIAWLEERGVRLKQEDDGRMFPITDSSSTIIDCLLQQADLLGVEILKNVQINQIDGHFVIQTNQGNFQSSHLLLATGSAQQGHEIAAQLGHRITPTVPSLFTFNCPESPLRELSGIAVNNVQISYADFKSEGPLLITHFGFSGPAALKLSAFAARALAESAYTGTLFINWFPQSPLEPLLLQAKKENGFKKLSSLSWLPRRLWEKLIAEDKPLNQYPDKQLKQLAARLHKDPYPFCGKTTHKEEFVTCGGVCLDEIDFKTMQSKKYPHLYFAGEIIDIDGLTGGFNFQNAWTTSWHAGQAIAASAAWLKKSSTIA
jgi:predicted Rossmann fold flavoprotein